MAFQIRATSTGPLIDFDGDLIALMDQQQLITACEANESLLADLWTHISTELQDSVSVIIDGVSSNMSNVSPQKTFAYVNSILQYTNFKNIQWANYVRARDAAASEG